MSLLQEGGGAAHHPHHGRDTERESGSQRVASRRFRARVAALAISIAAVAPAITFAQVAANAFVDYEKRIKSAEMVSPLKDDLFGESVNLHNGATEFTATDVSLAGNNSLPVRISRRFKVDVKVNAPLTSQGFDGTIDPLGGFGAWDIDVPYLYGMFDVSYGWTIGPNRNTARCSAGYAPGTSEMFGTSEIFSGYFLRIPGEGDQELTLLADEHPRPSDGRTYRWGTRNLYRGSCTSSVDNYPGEGFSFVDPQGLRYTFGHAITRNAGVLEKQVPNVLSDQAPNRYVAQRQQVFLMATRVEDRFGNYVDYHYTGDHLDWIASSDGRRIDLTWTGNSVTKVTADGKDWIYTYGSAMTVEAPDHSKWTYQPSGSLMVTPAPALDDNGACSESLPASATGFAMDITHPSGAKGLFNFGYIRHGRSGTPASACTVDYIGPPDQGSTVYRSLKLPDYSYTYSLVTKTVTGPGISPLQWSYDWEDPTNGRAELGSNLYCQTCDQDMVTFVTEPNGTKKEYVYGALWNYNEGRLLEVRTKDTSNNVVKSEVYDYVSEAEAANGLPFPKQWGIATGSDNSAVLYNRPIKQTVITQSGTAFRNRVDAFDSLARPRDTTRFNDTYSRSERTEFEDNLQKWVLSQPKKVMDLSTGKEVSATTYDPASALPLRNYAFGRLQQVVSYNGDGTVATVADGRELATTLTNWKRGIPQSIRFPATRESPAGAVKSAVVANDGTIESVTDEKGVKTCYTYDLGGRVASVTFASELQPGVCKVASGPSDTTAWNQTTFAFEQMLSAEYGLPASHWRQTIATGNARRITYYDAYWRPVVEEAYDAANASGTRSVTVKRYDSAGLPAFQSYPVRSISAYTDGLSGTRTFYDTLNRPRRAEQDSELGTLVATTQYPTGLSVATTNFRQKTTTNSYLAWDTPSNDLLVRSEQPEGKVVELDRHPTLGHVRAITQHSSDNTVSLVRRYVYDAQMQLCKVVEPETGATVSDYDAAGNLAWSASGLAMSSLTECNRSEASASGRKVVRQYDGRNRVTAISFPDGVGDQAFSYWPDGRVASISTINEGQQAANAYTYYAKGLPKDETLSVSGGPAQSIGYRYDQNGNLASHIYPSGRAVAYVPNALGQATQAGSYATGVAYFPNGGMSAFTYGNGITHSLIQNARGLPDRSLDSIGGTKILDDGYVYDPNGNVMSIVDGARGGRTSRDMTYDGLDRLQTATSQMFGSAVYGYDALDNLRSVKVAGRDHIYDYDGSWRLTNVRNAVGGASVIGMGYDLQGNLTNKNGQAYRFDFGNRLREATTKETYRYDGHGRRIESVSVVNGAPIGSLYGQDGVLRAQRDRRQAKAIEYIYLNGSQVARVTDVIAPWTPSLQSPSYSPQSTFTVQWPAVGGATSYEVQEAANGSTWTALSTSGTSTSVSRPAGSYQYRARACNSAGCGDWGASTATTVELAPGSPPTLSAPGTAPSGDYTISWTAVTTASSYILEESIAGGSWVIASPSSATSRSYSGRAEGSYAYRVKACNGAGCSAYSASVAVQAVYQPGGVTVSAPAASYTGSFQVTWTSGSTSTTSYRLDESTNGGAWVSQTVSNTVLNVTGKSTGTYTYRVAACNAAGCGPVSASAATQVTLPPAEAPTVSAPSSAPYGNYTVSWTTVAGATSYALEESINGGGWAGSYSGTLTSNAYGSRPAGSYVYRSRACNAGGCGPYSATASVQSAYPPAAPTLSAPSTSYNGAYSIAWSSPATTTSYRLEENFNGGAWTLIHNAAATSTSVSGRSQGVYGYRVIACNGIGCSAPSSTASVQVILPPGPTSVAAPASSASGNYNLNWSSTSNASSYQVEESQNGGSWSLLYNGSGLTIGVASRPNGSHQYRARACNVAGCSGNSAIATTVVSLPPATPAWLSSHIHLIYYGEVIRGGGCTVSWASSTNAISYNVKITNGPTAYSGGDTTASSGFGNNLCASSHQVQACNAGGCSAWTPPSQQQTTEEHYPDGEVPP